MRFILTLCLIFFSASCFADEQKGEIELKITDGIEDSLKRYTGGNDIKYTVKFYVKEFFGSYVIVANPSLMNIGKSEKYFSFNVAFFDKDRNLIGSASQYTKLKPGDNSMMGSSISALPFNEWNKIKYFQFVTYELPVN